MSEPGMNIERLCSLYAIGRIEDYELPTIAESLIESGNKSPALVSLAILESPYRQDRKRLFEKALAELGRLIPSPEEAAIELSREVAREIVSGATDEYEGAMRIWKEILDFVDPVPETLWVFKSSASAIEDCLIDTEEHGGDHAEFIAKCRNDIRAASEKLDNPSK